MELTYIALGANLGQAADTVLAAAERLAQLPQTRLLQVSSLYSSAPVDSSGDDYVNAVAALHTGLSAQELLSAIQAIETDFGRERPYRNAPRTLDLDILLYGELILDSTHLQLPHPRMTERAFVLLPLCEIAPDIQIPGRGLATDYLPAVAQQTIFRLPAASTR
ncbi:2-amino-4-hydroxy-6-hydroxymethyldihydropteridine diphosphokinase [Undibacterium rugosum]|uniref:2-amino-4-hydroxy-6-hydroxymethyldihydropteridine pyrophosphokinase n=1 Tax=Undibacterium rugosum TaxID=2762291 RepID=A0A923IB80_9BURK|nr:2-amino-4-hydroxy-6-hydroxymethyldihydropteridine diphosphokinase [Undibacterium rugosum]MBC3936015.1 2-amino-4-hydroxy-6-hydroxymethyldihydropteridine diphosphokinase [Undibacterium rugosum]MBR7778652.1 2-amino-4-hydroxy-6-hydroxymethyldihydropteridine diphosphokinase [Undibacterium rugosum]